MEYHEKALQGATSADFLRSRRQGDRCIHLLLAENSKREDHNSEIRARYGRCKDCAQLSKDATFQSIACHESKCNTGALRGRRRVVETVTLHVSCRATD